MSYILRVEPHPLGVVVSNEGDRELLIEGETCCCMNFEELKRIAETTRQVEIADETAAGCRLIRL